MQAFVPKNRKPKFDFSLNIIDLTNIPLVVGAVYVKWHLPSSSAAEHRGRTDKAQIREHKATWEYSKVMPVRLTIDKSMMLQPCEIEFEILQDYHDGGRGGRVHLGNVRLNLAEYTNAHEVPILEAAHDGEDGIITRRYLMQDSKVNATLKVGIGMKQTEGDTNYIPPPLKSAMVIGGIAGIMSAEASGEAEDMPSLASKSRELSEAQDIYRRTLAATWACEAGELAPDKLIEDIFAGGDGGRVQKSVLTRRIERQFRPSSRHADDEDEESTNSETSSTNSSGADSKRTVTRQTLLSPDHAHHSHHRHGSREHHGHSHHRHHDSNGNGNAHKSKISNGNGGGNGHTSHNSASSTVSGRGSIVQQMQHSAQPGHRRKGKLGESGSHEVTEFDLRDDLRSWNVAVT